MFDDSLLYALSKNQQDSQVYKINISESALAGIRENFAKGFEDLGRMDAHNLSPNYKLDDGECACIRNFAVPDVIFDAIRNPLHLQAVTGADFSDLNVKALFMGEIKEMTKDEKYTIVFKRLYMSSILKHSCLNILLSGDVYTDFQNDAIAIPEISHASYANGTLLFMSYKIANEMIDLADYYRSATTNDLKLFQSMAVCHGSLQDFANTKARRLIAFINDSHVLENYDFNVLDEAAREQGITLEQDASGKVLLNLEKRKETMLVLDFLAENTFLATFSKRLNRTNSREAC